MQPNLWDDLRQSLYNNFDHILLTNGAYSNIHTGQVNAKGQDISTLFPTVDNQLYDVSGYIWQSAFHNWVYESGLVNSSPPIICSGVYVNNVFVPRGSGVHIDFINGRAIFDSPLSLSSQVKAAFSPKEYSFVLPNNNKAFKNKTKFEENSEIYIDSFPASPYIIYLPAIFVEIANASEAAFEFGGVTQTMPIFQFPILSRDLTDVERIGSLFCSKSTKTIPITPALSAPKFDFYNDLTENYAFCTGCTGVQNFAYLKSVKYSRFYEGKSEGIDPTIFGGTIDVEIFAIR